MTLRLLALSGSLRASSSSTALLRALAALAPAGVEVDVHGSLGDLPYFDPGLDLDPHDYRAPDPVLRLRAAIAGAQGLIVCTPEYAFGMPGVLKNALDWVVSMGVIEGKPVMALAASPSNTGGDRAHQGLLWVLQALNTRVLPEASFPLPRIRQRLDGAGQIADPALERQLRTALGALAEAAGAGAGRGGALIRIFVDADACPVKDEVYRVAGRYGLQVFVVSNRRLNVPRLPRVELKVVSGRFDAADDWIVESATPWDIAVTSDIPLAARVLAKDARALDPKGRIFSPDSIGDALAAREFSAFLRDMGEQGGGPAPFSPKDRSTFLQSLDTVIQSLLKVQRARQPIPPEPA